MRVIACGPEASGIELLYEAVASFGFPTVSRTMPTQQDWNLGVEAGDKVVCITRDEMETVRSALEHGYAPNSNRAMRRRKIATLLIEEQAHAAGVPILEVWYERLVEDRISTLEEIQRFLAPRFE